MDNPFDEILKRLSRIEELLNIDVITKDEVRRIKMKPVTANEACAYFSISRPTLKRWTDKGKIPVLRVGGVIRYDLDAVSDALGTHKKYKPWA